MLEVNVPLYLSVNVEEIMRETGLRDFSSEAVQEFINDGLAQYLEANVYKSGWGKGIVIDDHENIEIDCDIEFHWR